MKPTRLHAAFVGIALILGFATAPMAAAPLVANLTATQRTDTRLVDITYDVTADTPTVTISLEVSVDGGALFNVPITSASGDIGTGVAVGTGKAIVWDAAVDWNNQFSVQTRYRITADDAVPDGTALIPAGAFVMGRTSEDTDSDAPPVTVAVSRFYMAKYEATKELWDEVRNWGLSNGYTDLVAGGGKATDHPVHTVSWWDVVKWCNARSQKEGLTPVYSVSGAVMKTGTTLPSVNWIANGYRLPTEAEWEKAARGGISSKRFPWGTDTISHNMANFQNSGDEPYASGTTGSHPAYATGSIPYTAPAGSFAANGYGSCSGARL